MWNKCFGRAILKRSFADDTHYHLSVTGFPVLPGKA